MEKLRRGADHRRALRLLAASPEGLTESLLVYAHQVPIEVLVELIEAGLAKVRIERVHGRR
jgi:hypothetical protein